jgi:transposase-like protein
VRVVKSGHARGRQRWLCRRCQYQFTRRDGYGTPDEVKQVAVTLYGCGLSLNAVGNFCDYVLSIRLFGSHTLMDSKLYRELSDLAPVQRLP